MAVTKPEEFAKELAEVLRENNAARHRLDVESGPELICDTPDGPLDILAFTTNEGQDVFLKVEFA